MNRNTRVTSIRSLRGWTWTQLSPGILWIRSMLPGCGQRRTWNSCHNDWRTVRWRERKPWKRPMKSPGFAWFLCGESIGVILQLLNCPIAESHCFNVHVFVCLKIGYPQFRGIFPVQWPSTGGKKREKQMFFQHFQT